MKRIGTKVFGMIVVLALIFGLNAAVSMRNLNLIEASGLVISESYVQIQTDFADLGICFERSQKYINIICMVNNGDIVAGLTQALQEDWATAQQKFESIRQHNLLAIRRC